MGCSTQYLTPVTPAQYVYEFVDKIFYRGNNYISLNPYNYNMPDAYFRDSNNSMLSDHYPVSVNIQYELNPNLKLSDQFGGPHGTNYNDVNSIPASAVVQTIGMRSGSRVDQINGCHRRPNLHPWRLGRHGQRVGSCQRRVRHQRHIRRSAV